MHYSRQSISRMIKRHPPTLHSGFAIVNARGIFHAQVARSYKTLIGCFGIIDAALSLARINLLFFYPPMDSEFTSVLFELTLGNFISFFVSLSEVNKKILVSKRILRSIVFYTFSRFYL